MSSSPVKSAATNAPSLFERVHNAYMSWKYPEVFILRGETYRASIWYHRSAGPLGEERTVYMPTGLRSWISDPRPRPRPAFSDVFRQASH